MRKQFESKLSELQDEILKMGEMVEAQLQLALKALEAVDAELADRVVRDDAAVNAQRFAIEDKCVELIATQQPAARDLRAIVAVMNMIVDLERMGDQSKGIGKCTIRLAELPKEPQPIELKQMGEIVGTMLRQALTAYVENNATLAGLITRQDSEVDALYARLFSQVIENMTETKKQQRVLEVYEILRVGQELERIGDLATNIAERVIYISTGKLYEINVEPDDAQN